MGTLAADLRYALRMLWKSPGFTVASVLALALGIGANTAIFSVVNAVLLAPLPYPQPDRIVVVERTFPNGIGNSSSIPKFTFWKANNSVIDDLCAYDFAGPGFSLAGGDRPEQVKGIHASRGYFSVFGAKPFLGRVFAEDEDSPGGPRVVVLSGGLWKRRYGSDPQIIGKSVVLNSDPYTVIGVLDDRFQPDTPSDIWLPLQADAQSVNQAHYLKVAGRLKPGVTLAQANASLKLMGENYRASHSDGSMGKDEGVAAETLLARTVGQIRPMLLILTGAVGLVLLIACANVANLLLAQGATRQRELAIRTAVGAARGRIVRQLLTESLLLASTGAVFGLLLGYWGSRILVTLAPVGLPRLAEFAGGVPLNGTVLWFTLVVAMLTGILFGLVPALQSSRPDLNSTLKEASGRSGSGLKQNKARGLLVIGETALSVILLIGAVLLIRTFVSLRKVDPGIDPHNVLTMQTSLIGNRYATIAQTARLQHDVVERLEAIPGVIAASPAIQVPVVNMGLDLPFVVEGRPLQDKYHGDEFWRSVGPHYFDVFRIRLVSGRVFNERDVENSQPVVLINEAFMKKYFDKENPLGQRLTIARGLGKEFEDKTRVIIGVVRTVRENGLNNDSVPVYYIPSAQVPDLMQHFANGIVPQSWVVRTQADPAAMTDAVRQQFLAVDSQLAVAEIKTMDHTLEGATSGENFSMTLLGAFAALALVLAAIGIYGVVSYMVEQRTNEIGIRMALGARQSSVLGMVTRHGLLLASIGVLGGLAGAFGLTRFLAKLLYGVKPADPATFASVAVALLLVAAMASVIPALRATRVDPVIALRSE
jgi:putative ABC transport system permease protein